MNNLVLQEQVLINNVGAYELVAYDLVSYELVASELVACLW